MPTTREFSVQMEDKPGTLGKICRGLADRGVNILAFQSCQAEGKSIVHFVVDKPAEAKSVLDNEKVKYTEAQVAQVKLPHRPGELARAALKLGEANVNINYSYSGLEPSATEPFLIFGVVDASRAAKILDEVAKAARA